MSAYISVNPATEELIGEFPAAREEEIEAALDASVRAGARWRAAPLEERIAAMERLAAAFKAHRSRIAALISLEMGKPIVHAESEAERLAKWPLAYSELARSALAAHALAEVKERLVSLRYEALGVLLAIIPWNFPASLAIRAAVPALLAGDSVIVKPAPNTSRVAEAVTQAFGEAGFPDGLYQTLLLSNESARRVILDRRVQMVSFTGSVEAGRTVAAIAGEGLKRITLELGGSDPFIVLADADLGEAVDAAFRARSANAGQICCAPKRFIVQRALYRGFIDGLAQKISALTVGEPNDRAVQMGPLARADLRDKLREQTQRSLAAGGRIAARSACPQGKGFYHPALLIVDAPRDAAAWREELFGPVFPVCAFEREEEAIALANDSEFGLGACVFGADPAALDRVASGLACGTVALNGTVGVDPRIPFGGIKLSGFGRACGTEGLREASCVKAVLGA